MNEFEIIENFFLPISRDRSDVLCSIGDDAAVVSLEKGNYAISTDTLVEGVHFPSNICPEDLGYRAASVTLSDLAAMGAAPKFATMAITIPEAKMSWLESFSHGLGDSLTANGCLLVGGDTTKGPLVITLQVFGEILGDPIKRSGARVGDLVGVSGFLGDARAALDFIGGTEQGREIDFFLSRYLRPIPRIQFGLQAQDYLNAAIDVSDGLLLDLEHVAKSSGVSIELDMAKLPISASLDSFYPRTKAIEYASTGGDDYELAFTTSVDKIDLVKTVGENLDLKISVIGKVNKGQGVVCKDSYGVEMIPEGSMKGYTHF